MLAWPGVSGIGWMQAQPAAVQAAPEQGAAVAEFRRTVEAGPLFAALAKRFGQPADAKVQADEDGVVLSYSFRGGAHLEAKSNSAIEHWEQSATLPGLTREGALRLLKTAARAGFGEGGCGLDWAKPEDQPDDGAKGSHAVVFRGDGCNCQARILMRGKAIVGLSLSSSC